MGNKCVSVFDIISDFEAIQIEFNRVSHLIQLYRETLEGNFRFTQQEEPFVIAMLMKRSELYFSQFEALEILFNCALNKMENAVNEGYAFAREQKTVAAQK